MRHSDGVPVERIEIAAIDAWAMKLDAARKTESWPKIFHRHFFVSQRNKGAAHEYAEAPTVIFTKQNGFPRAGRSPPNAGSPTVALQQ